SDIGSSRRRGTIRDGPCARAPEARRRSSLALPHHIDETRRLDADRGAGRACPHAGRAARYAHAHVAFDRVLRADARLHSGLGLVLARPAAGAEEQPAPQARLLGRHRGQLDDAVGAVAFAIAAADALAEIDEYLAVRVAVDRVGRAIRHAVRVFAMPARGGHVKHAE